MSRLLIFLVIGFLVSCNAPDNKSLYKEYINSYVNKGFESISNILADTILIKDIENYEVRYSKQDFRTYYQWDSVFQPRYEIMKLTSTDSTVNVTQSVSSLRFEFLGNNPLITKQRIYFDNRKIKTIENLKYLNVDWEIWTSKRDSLINWIDSNHHELAGFIYDMTPNGAEKYIEAMRLYNNGL